MMNEQVIPIDVFAHVLAPRFYQKMLKIDATIPQKAGYVNNKALIDLDFRQSKTTVNTKQIISMMNLNPEDFVDAETALKLCWDANKELSTMVVDHPEQFVGAVAMVPMNNLDGARKIMEKQVQNDPNLMGIQLFTRALGKSIADSEYDQIFALAEELQQPIWLHPVFDERKPDNNIVFSWKYELTQAMQQLVVNGVFQHYPKLKIIVHHAGAMVPFFAGRIKTILSEQQNEDFHKFYVDTAILGNPEALNLTIAYFGVDHVLFGTDAPFGIPPVGASQVILEAIDQLDLSEEQRQQVLVTNIKNLIDSK